MQRVISMVLLVIIVSGCNKPSGESSSKWVMFGGDDIYQNVYYNPTSVSKVGDIATMWVIGNFPSDSEIKSRKWLKEFNCKSKTSRDIYRLDFSETMGDGKLVYLVDVLGKIRTQENVDCNNWNASQSQEYRDAACKNANDKLEPYMAPRKVSLSVNSDTYTLKTDSSLENSSLSIALNDANSEFNNKPNSFGKFMWKLACGEK